MKYYIGKGLNINYTSNYKGQEKKGNIDKLFIIEEDDKYFELFSNKELNMTKDFICRYLDFIGNRFINEMPILTSDWDFTYHKVTEDKFIEELVPYWKDKDDIKKELAKKEKQYNIEQQKRKIELQKISREIKMKELKEKLKEKQKEKNMVSIKKYIRERKSN